MRGQFHDVGPARQRFRNVLNQSELLRPGKHELSISRAVGIDRCLEMSKKAWGILHLVDDDGRRMTLKEARRLLFDLLRFGWEVKGHERVIRKLVPESGSLAGLPGAGEDNDGPRLRKAFQASLNIARSLNYAKYTMLSQILHDKGLAQNLDGLRSIRDERRADVSFRHPGDRCGPSHRGAILGGVRSICTLC